MKDLVYKSTVKPKPHADLKLKQAAIANLEKWLQARVASPNDELSELDAATILRLAANNFEYPLLAELHYPAYSKILKLLIDWGTYYYKHPTRSSTYRLWIVKLKNVIRTVEERL